MTSCTLIPATRDYTLSDSETEQTVRYTSLTDL